MCIIGRWIICLIFCEVGILSYSCGWALIRMTNEKDMS